MSRSSSGLVFVVVVALLLLGALGVTGLAESSETECHRSCRRNDDDHPFCWMACENARCLDLALHATDVRRNRTPLELDSWWNAPNAAPERMAQRSSGSTRAMIGRRLRRSVLASAKASR